VQNSSRELRRY